eukprot:1160298-Prorocentrum_minimum.AAC.3
MAPVSITHPHRPRPWPGIAEGCRCGVFGDARVEELGGGRWAVDPSTALDVGPAPPAFGWNRQKCPELQCDLSMKASFAHCPLLQGSAHSAAPTLHAFPAPPSLACTRTT